MAIAMPVETWSLHGPGEPRGEGSALDPFGMCLLLFLLRRFHALFQNWH